VGLNLKLNAMSSGCFWSVALFLDSLHEVQF